MKKFIKLFILILLLPICVLAYTKPTTEYIHFLAPVSYIKPCDSGFDADYDDWDSGSDYGSSSDDDDDYYSSSRDPYNRNYNRQNNGSSRPMTWLDAVIIIITVPSCFAFPFIIYALSNKLERHKRFKNREREIISSLPGKIETDSTMSNFIYQSYVKIQIAWMNRNLTTVRDLLTDEMYNMYQKQIKTLLRKHQINVMKDFKYKFAYISQRDTEGNNEIIETILAVSCKDYIIDENTKKVVQGNKQRTRCYYYKLSFIKSKESNIKNCPNCGAKLAKQGNQNCPYCGSNIYEDSTGWILCDKEMLYQLKKD